MLTIFYDYSKLKIVNAKQLIALNSDKGEILSTFFAMIPGANYRVVWERKLKTKKAFPEYSGRLSKRVVALVRNGVNYENLGAVKTGRANGDLPAENAGLPWGQWEIFPRVISHNEKFYLRLYPASMNNSPLVTYYLDGRMVDAEFCMEFCYSNDFAHSGDILCFTIGLQSLISLERVLPVESRQSHPFSIEHLARVGCEEFFI